MKKFVIMSVLINVLAVCAFAQSTEFTYQGRLLDNSVPATANYDFEFSLWDSLVTGTQGGTTQTITGVAVTSGQFSVRLDFGANFPGATRFLQIAVRPAGGGAYTTLAPRQPITSAPYAIRSLNSTTADTATNSLQLGGVAAGQYVVTTDPRMTDERNPVAGSANYIQNQNAGPQISSNFRISGTGTANIFSANTQYNIGGIRVLSVAGNSNVFAGVNAGIFNTTGFTNSFFGRDAGFGNTIGCCNSFFGHEAGRTNTAGNLNSFFGDAAGRENTIGSQNSFFGLSAGRFNTTGDGNSFFGIEAGDKNTTGANNSFFGSYAGVFNTTGANNSFFGRFAGFSNTTGSNNTLIGQNANIDAGNLTFATAIGAQATVATSSTIALGRNLGQDTVQIPGALNVAGALTANGSGLTNFNAGNITTGTLANARLGQIPTANIADGAVTSAKIPTDQVVKSVNSLTDSVTLAAGSNITITPSGNTLTIASTGDGNAILNQTAQQAGANFNISGTGTADILNVATQYNIGGSRVFSIAGQFNTFAGVNAGVANTTGNANSFFGRSAGFSNTTGQANSFFGGSAGVFNTTGSLNSFFGRDAGFSNTTGFDNSFFGYSAGVFNTTGSLNSFFGRSAGAANTTGDSNSFFGFEAGVSNTTGFDNSFFGQDAGRLNTTGENNSFFGRTAGRFNTTGFDNSFFGSFAGDSNMTGGGNSFFGRDAGLGNTTGDNNTIIGNLANVGADNLTFATAIGAGAIVVTSNQIQLGRNGTDTVSIGALAAATATDLCITSLTDGVLAECSSSGRYKKNIANLTFGLDLVRQLRPVKFDWIERGEADLGLVAEEVAAVDPLLATYNNKGEIQGVKYKQLSVVLINAVKEQQTQIEAQQKQIDELKQIICSLKPDAKVCKNQE